MALTTGVILADSGVPNIGIGADGDHYRNTDNQDFYAKVGGVWTLVGNLDSSAADGVGTTWLSGSGVPDNGDGSDGNYYRNTDNEDVYVKASGLWNLIGNIAGNGADGVGSTLLAGSGAPDNGDGSDGFFYLDRDNGNFYEKVSGLWTLRGSLLLPIPGPGQTIGSSEGAPGNGTGEDGDYCRDVLNQDIYFKDAGVWDKIGSWEDVEVPVTSIFLSGAGAPSDLIGEDGNHYRDTETQDIYQKDLGTWTLLGSWAAGGGGSGPFVVGTWDMTGAPIAAVPVVGVSMTIGGADPDFTLTPVSPLELGSPYSAAAAFSAGGVSPTGTGQAWMRFEQPAYDGGDNVFGVMTALVNETATIADIVAVFNGGSPVGPVIGPWAMTLAANGDAIFGDFSRSGGMGTANLNAVAGDDVYVGFDYDTGEVLIQRATDTALVSAAPASLVGLPVGEKMKVVTLVLATSDTIAFLAGSITADFSTTDAGKTGFMAAGTPVIPVGAEDGKVYEIITSGGVFGGSTVEVGDFVQFYDNESKVIITRVVPDSTAAVAAVADDLVALGLRVDGAETDITALEVQGSGHEDRIASLEAAGAAETTWAGLQVESITVPPGHTVTPYDLTTDVNSGAYRVLTVSEPMALIRVLGLGGAGGCSKFYVKFQSSGLLSTDNIVFNHGQYPVSIKASSFGKTIYECLFDQVVNEWVVKAIPLAGQLATTHNATEGGSVALADRNDSTRHTVVNLPGIGDLTAYSVTLPDPRVQPEGVCTLEIIGDNFGNSITTLTVVVGGISNPIGTANVGDVFEVKVRQSAVGPALDVVKLNLL